MLNRIISINILLSGPIYVPEKDYITKIRIVWEDSWHTIVSECFVKKIVMKTFDYKIWVIVIIS